MICKKNHRVSKTRCELVRSSKRIFPYFCIEANRNADSEMEFGSRSRYVDSVRENNRDIRVQLVWYAPITRNNKIHLFCGEKEGDPRYALFPFLSFPFLFFSFLFFFAFKHSIIHPVLDN